MKRLPLIIIALAVLITSGMFLLNRSVVMPSESRYELMRDSLSNHIGKDLLIDSVTHVLVDMSVIRNEYTTDKGIVLSYQFVENYFKPLDTLTLDSIHLIDVDGTKVELDIKEND